MTSRFLQSHNEVENVNNIGKARLLILNVKNTKVLQILKTRSDAVVTVVDEQIEVVEQWETFKARFTC